MSSDRPPAFTGSSAGEAPSTGRVAWCLAGPAERPAVTGPHARRPAFTAARRVRPSPRVAGPSGAWPFGTLSSGSSWRISSTGRVVWSLRTAPPSGCCHRTARLWAPSRSAGETPSADRVAQPSQRSPAERPALTGPDHPAGPPRPRRAARRVAPAPAEPGRPARPAGPPRRTAPPGGARPPSGRRSHNFDSSSIRSSSPSDPCDSAAMCQAFASNDAPWFRRAFSRPSSQARSPSL